MLPNVRLYVDDLEAIVAILGEALEGSIRSQAEEREPLVRGSRPKVVEADVRVIPIQAIYRIGDIEMDSIDDLLDQGGSIKDLSVTVFSTVSSRTCGIEFRHFVSPILEDLVQVGDENKQWQVYAQVLDVCNRRRMVLKDLVEDLPSWLNNGVYALIGVLAVASYETKGLARTILGIVGAIWVSLMVISSFVESRPSRVYLVRSHEKDKVAKETRKKYLEHAITFLLGGAATEIIHFVGAKLLK
jgi:hypothetical protein